MAGVHPSAGLDESREMTEKEIQNSSRVLIVGVSD
jgi:hypothetical protein